MHPRAPLPAAVSIRRRAAGDDGFLAGLALQAFAEYSEHAGWHAVRRLPGLVTLIACRGADPIGFAAIEPESPQSMTLPALAVIEPERGRGVGRRLLQAAEQLARTQGASRLTLHTADANLAAIELFMKCGFRVVQRIPRYYRGVFGACRMLKSLAVR